MQYPRHGCGMIHVILCRQSLCVCVCVCVHVCVCVCRDTAVCAQVRFEAEEAFHELGRLGLATPVSTEATTSTDAHSQQPSELVQAAQASASPPGTETQELSGTEYRVVSLERAKQLIEKHWSGLLWQRVDGILREFED